MTTTVIGVFEPDSVRKVTQDLMNAGFGGRDIDVIEGEEREIVSEIVGRGYDEVDAKGFAKAVKRGKKLLATKAPDTQVDRVVQIMERHESDADEGKAQEETKNSRSERTESVPVIEEELEVEKRKVARGGVRLTSTVHEQPVEETVRLREEQVETERRPVDRRLSEDEAEAAFQDRTIEMNETTEELEVSKEARVVEEVALTKSVTDHEEKLKDKVRRTEVEIEKIEPSSRRKS
jgi:stress response protein YsnF